MTWTSHGPVQINVGRDLHIHGGHVQQDDVPRVHGAGPQWGALLGMLAYNGMRLAVGVLLLGVLLVVTVGAIGFYLLARVANGVLFVEQALGGAPTRIIAAPARMLPMLGHLESDYAE
jgi:hypothetical protein